MLKSLVVFVVALFVVTAPQTFNVLASAQATSTNTDPSWLSDAEPTLTLQELVDPTRPSYEYDPQKDCEQTTLIIRPKRLLQAQKTVQACAVSTQFGLYGNGYLQLEGTETAGRLSTSNFGTVSPFIGIPKSKNILIYSTNQGLISLQLIENARDYLVSNVNSLGEVHYSLPHTTPRKAIIDYGNFPLYFHLDSQSFSNNGKWMVVDSNQGAVRINTETGDVLPFQPRQKYGGGLNPSMQTAVSGDGRFVIVSSAFYNYWRLYDIATCEGDSWDAILASCQHKSYYNTFSGLSESSFNTRYHRFLDGNNILSFVTTKHNDHTAAGWHILTAPHKPVFGTDTPAFKYLGLGDSFAAGEGAYKYRAATDIPNNKCHLSLVSYPYLLIDRFAYETGESVACSGAVMQDVLDKSEVYDRDGPQASNKNGPEYNDEIFSNFLPGYRAQLHFVEQNKPEIITMSIGGNDVGFADKIKYCIQPGTCYPTYEDRLELLYEIDRMSWDLARAYKQVKESAHPNSRIYAISYPDIVKPGGNCGVNVLFDRDETIFAHHLVDYLNSAVRRAAAQAGVFYVDVQSSLNNHRLCEATYSDTAVNGATAGNDELKIGFVKLNGPVGKESFHPNEQGHRLMSRAIAEATNNFTAPMPMPNNSEQPPAKEGLEILNRPKSGRSLNAANYDTDTENNVIYKQSGPIDYLVIALNALSPGSTVQAGLQSTPTSLGTFVVSNDRTIAIPNTAIPSDFPAGYHMLHLYGTNLAGEPTDIQRLLYVASSEDDIDGDGIPNEEEICLYGEPAGLDYDQDGIDDACDGFIGEPVAELVNVPTVTNNSPPTDEAAENNRPSTPNNEDNQPEQREVTSQTQNQPLVGAQQPPTVATAIANNQNQNLESKNQTKSEQDVLGNISTEQTPDQQTAAVSANGNKSAFWRPGLMAAAGLAILVFGTWAAYTLRQNTKA